MVYKKIFGLILVLLGLVIIFLAIFETFNIFTAQKEPPQIFEKIIQTATGEEKIEKAKSPEEKMQILQQEMITEQFQKMLPQETIMKLLNLMSWSIGAFILFTGGGKISQIGVSLIK